MLIELTTLLISFFESQMLALISLLDFFLKSAVLVMLVLYFERVNSPFFTNKQKSNLWLVAVVLLGLLPFALFISTNLAEKLYTAADFTLLTVLVPYDVAVQSIDSSIITLDRKSAVLAIYFTVLLLQLCKLTLSLVRIRNIRKAANFTIPLDAQLLLTGLCTRLEISEKIQLGVSSLVQTPITFGATSPTIILPNSSYCADLELLESVLLHELSHVKRRDQLNFVLCYLIASINWFNPAIWFALKRYSDEAEYACDDEVICHGKTPKLFASQLISIARTLLLKSENPVAGKAMLARNQLTQRVENILHANCRTTKGRTHSSSLPINSLLLVFVLASTGKLLALENAANFVTEDLRVVYSQLPDFPVTALEKGATGYTQFVFSVNELGKVDPDSIILEGSEPKYLFDASSITALNNFEFSPRKVNGNNVATSGVRYRFDFRIKVSI